MKLRIIVALSLWSFFTLVFSQNVPYHPTTLLRQSSDLQRSDVAYAFFRVTPTEVRFVSINLSSTISTARIPYNILPSNSLSLNEGTTFIPSISSSGEILVYTGSCLTSAETAVWRYAISNTSREEDGTWTQLGAITAHDEAANSSHGASYLSSAISFSSTSDDGTQGTALYVFGGMCPPSNSTSTTWQHAATYSNDMLKLVPSGSGIQSYEMDVVSVRDPPVSEAGFTVTGLVPTFPRSSNREAQQQNFVLLGGHTKNAFINMSQVAIWSLPEESWNFVTIQPPTPIGNTQLVNQSAAVGIDSRSGHSTVLSEDGSSLIVFGGWVGSIDQAAEPQLAVLKIGTGYGGSGDWKWSMPAAQALPPGSGLYGHGALMLPGNVMMVLGGYDISRSVSRRRAADTDLRAMFFNATSLTWTSEYTNPSPLANTTSPQLSNAKPAKSLGLGLGLGLGIGAVLVAIAVYFCYARYLRRRRDSTRGKQLQCLSLAAPNFHASPAGDMVQQTRARDVDRCGRVPSYESVSQGAYHFRDGDYPAPGSKLIPRKPLHLHSRIARGLYQPAPSYDTSPNTSSRGNNLSISGPIHPIIEIDEDVALIAPVTVARAYDDHVARYGESREDSRCSDPFTDRPSTNSSVLPRRGERNTPTPESPAKERDGDIQEWDSDWAAADALLTSQTRSHSGAGRISPTRRAQLIAASSPSSVSGAISEVDDSGRTASNLSERSITASLVSRSGSSSQGARCDSLRGFIAQAINPFSSSILGSTSDLTTINTDLCPSIPQGPRALVKPGSAASTKSAFHTAQTSLTILPAEGECLLGRWRSSGEGSPPRSTSLAQSSGSPSKQKPFSKNRSHGWLGSIRRAFTNEGQASFSSPHHSSSPPQIDDGPLTPTMTGAVEPRRTVSAGATLWRRKQGREDWADSSGRRSNTFTADRPLLGTERLSQESEDWDIERAVEGRVVQVMFTVPREKLRVVNQDVSTEGSEAGDENETLPGVRGGVVEEEEEGLGLLGGTTVVGEGEGEGEGEGTSLPREKREKGKEKERVWEIVEKMEERSVLYEV